MKAHAMDMSEAILRSNLESFGRLVGKLGYQNQALIANQSSGSSSHYREKIKDYTWIQTPRRRWWRLFIYGSQRSASSRTNPTDTDRTSSQPSRSFCRNDAFDTRDLGFQEAKERGIARLPVNLIQNHKKQAWTDSNEMSKLQFSMP